MKTREIPELSKEQTDMFFSKMSKKDNGCWEWVGQKKKGHAYECGNGYGYFSVKINNNWELYLAHRISYSLHIGKIPQGMLVCHSCDNPPCVNPAHLWCGSEADNIRDAGKKGRMARHEKHHNAKLTMKYAREIRKKYKSGEFTQRVLGTKYGVKERTICDVINNNTWSE